jgi:hypothetical protein
VGKTISGKKAFIALGLTAGNKTAARISHSGACRFEILLEADKAINAIGGCELNNQIAHNLWDVNRFFHRHWRFENGDRDDRGPQPRSGQPAFLTTKSSV